MLVMRPEKARALYAQRTSALNAKERARLPDALWWMGQEQMVARSKAFVDLSPFAPSYLKSICQCMCRCKVEEELRTIVILIES